MHAILRNVLKTGKLNIQAHTPAISISEWGGDGLITVTTDRGDIRAKAVVHTTNRWASHLLPEFSKLILGDKATIAAIKAPEGFIKHTGAQHWDAVVNVGPTKWFLLYTDRLTRSELSPATTATFQCYHSRRRQTVLGAQT